MEFSALVDSCPQQAKTKSQRTNLLELYELWCRYRANENSSVRPCIIFQPIPLRLERFETKAGVDHKNGVRDGGCACIGNIEFAFIMREGPITHRKLLFQDIRISPRVNLFIRIERYTLNLVVFMQLRRWKHGMMDRTEDILWTWSYIIERYTLTSRCTEWCFLSTMLDRISYCTLKMRGFIMECIRSWSDRALPFLPQLET